MILAANWKLNKDPQEAKEFYLEFLEKCPQESWSQFIFFPSAINFETTAECLSSKSISWGLQNTYYQNEGAFTGENSASLAKKYGATHVLVGHSERRQFFGETLKGVALKIKNLQSLGLVPLLCVGESLEERESRKTESVVEEQLRTALEFCDFSKEILLAYEPVWAIGTGKVATPEEAEAVHKFLKTIWNELCPSKNIQILYGGSVKAENSPQLFSQKSIDGFLVGGASLKVDSFLGIMSACL